MAGGDEKRAKLIGSVAAAVVTALVGGGAIGYQVKGVDAHTAPLVTERPVTRAEFEEVRSQGLGNERKVLALEVEVRVGLGAVSTSLDANTKAINRVEMELVELRKGRR